MHRAKRYLEDAGVPTQRFVFPSPPGNRPARQIRTQRRDTVEAIRELITWPRSPRREWCKGFLAGIFDAEGSHGEVVRIHNTDPEIIGWTTEALRLLGFTHTVEDRGRGNGLKVVRLLGGLKRKLAFLPVRRSRDHPQAHH